MTMPPRTAHTYTADDVSGHATDDLRRALDTSSEQPAYLVAPDGTQLELPSAMHDALRHVVEALSAGMGVTISPTNARLTTQEAADFLGISRPTLVRILDRGELPMERPGRHRYVRLTDLIAYQEATRKQRRGVLEAMQGQSHADGLYDATDAPAPSMR